MQPCTGMWFLHDGTGLTLCCLAHGELAWLILEPHTGQGDCLKILLSCFRARPSGLSCMRLLRRPRPPWSFLPFAVQNCFRAWNICAHAPPSSLKRSSHVVIWLSDGCSQSQPQLESHSRSKSRILLQIDAAILGKIFKISRLGIVNVKDFCSARPGRASRKNNNKFTNFHVTLP